MLRPSAPSGVNASRMPDKSPLSRIICSKSVLRVGDFSHLNSTGEAAMVDVSAKASSAREAQVAGEVLISRECAQKLDPQAGLEIARVGRIAGIQAAKQTSALIPLCHQVPLTKVELTIEFARESRRFAVLAATKTMATTGVEMEAFVAASVASLTIYDMIKAIDPGASVGPFQLVRKTGGKAAFPLTQGVRSDAPQ